MTQVTEHYIFNEEQLDYWTDIFLKLDLERRGILLVAFLENPYQYLRLIGMKELQADTPVSGNA